ncbi:DUF4083 domain-containing protein [Jeotgalibacillus marinus]|uniref:DUF4083 domain-containing protein n=1 Tax=Jeotgalibacillus marinus TaxID=86667 RepID=A0ABV3Q4S3_9BACL
MGGFNAVDAIFQLVMLLFLAGLIVGVVLIVRSVFGRKKQLDRIESMLKEQREKENK